MKDKFRIWNAETKSYLKKYDEHFNVSGLYVVGVWANINQNIYHPKFLTFQSFTGLTDKNGKEIYEGDIIRFQTKFEHGQPETFEEEVYYDENYACFCFGREVGFTMFDCGLAKSSMEVIGNIFEKKHENS